MIKAGIIGAAGYTGGEVIRLLLNHPEVELSFVQSESQHGKKVYLTHQDCFGATELIFDKQFTTDVDVIFLCKGHGESKTFLDKHDIPKQIKIIDLSQDFRHKNSNSYKEKVFTYGLPELHKEKIQKSDYIANPGCFATCIQLALLPLAATSNIQSDIHVAATTGSTGAGQSATTTNHFSWRSNNHSGYKLLSHQHEKEIIESVTSLQTSFADQLYVIPQRGAFTKGIYSVMNIKGDYDIEAIKKQYSVFYATHPFSHIVPFEIDVKQVVNTNNCFISIQQEKNNLIIVSAIDNLLKGAAGQAIQNMNIMFGLDETTGLKLKATAF